MRAWFYLIMCMVEDEETQKNGSCVVAFYGMNNSLGPQRTSDQDDDKRDDIFLTYDHRSLFTNLIELNNSLPFRIGASHICLASPKLRNRLFLAISGLIQHAFFYTRMKFHQGPFLKILYDLMTYGIAPDVLPISSDGSVKLDMHEGFLASRRFLEREQQAAAASANSSVAYDNNNDSQQPLGGLDDFSPIPIEEMLTTTLSPTAVRATLPQATSAALPGAGLLLRDMLPSSTNPSQDRMDVLGQVASRTSQAVQTGPSSAVNQSNKPSVQAMQAIKADVQVAPPTSQITNPVSAPTAPTSKTTPAGTKTTTAPVGTAGGAKPDVTATGQPIIWNPTSRDVLLGRGYLGHAGNYSFRKIIDQYSPQYENVSKRSEKADLAKRVVKEIQDDGGRFLKMTETKPYFGGFIEVTQEEAYEKVKNRFRQVRSNTKMGIVNYNLPPPSQPMSAPSTQSTSSTGAASSKSICTAGKPTQQQKQQRRRSSKRKSDESDHDDSHSQQSQHQTAVSVGGRSSKRYRKFFDNHQRQDDNCCSASIGSDSSGGGGDGNCCLYTNCFSV